jgi:hypothetical protein
MIINNAPQNEAIMSNVSEIGEFRIRNSAKAFNILSSGLYANKIKAIIRELSCNAVDSHVAAGKADVPFDVHLPNSLEPWFSIRDYGTGLNHEQVTNIYTTYFESTKTTSNEFIGALGLGSKSPFSYTDNFTVTAVQQGIKRIYSAFINDQGVPSIAKMAEEATDEPNGVEVKFAVEDRYDFYKFEEEAHRVYKWFKQRPVVTGVSHFEFEEVAYESENIIPGVHSTNRGHRSMAVMGNIAYPIEVPNVEKNLGELRRLLDCNLVMEFGIGELDFQASREGLSYIPQTVEAIRKKLEALNSVLADKIAEEADLIKNSWERALFLQEKGRHQLWNTAVQKYATDRNFELLDFNYGCRTKAPKISVGDLAEMNIAINAFEKSPGNAASTNLKSYSQHCTLPTGVPGYEQVWEFGIGKKVHFVVNDTKIGALERAKFHFKEEQVANNVRGYDNGDTVFVLNAIDKTKKMNIRAFMKALHNPPTKTLMRASIMREKEREVGSKLAKNVTIMKLEEKGYGGYYRQRDVVWRDAGKAASFDPKKTYYYMPLSGFNVESAYGCDDVKELNRDLSNCGIKAINVGTLYGVRKGDIEFIKTQKNWINIEEHISKSLKNIDPKLVNSFLRRELDGYGFLRYNMSIVSSIDQKSPFAELANMFDGTSSDDKADRYAIARLIKRYSPKTTFDPEVAIQSVRAKCDAIVNRYPLINCIRSASDEAVAEYINLIDKEKGI